MCQNNSRKIRNAAATRAMMARVGIGMKPMASKKVRSFIRRGETALGTFGTFSLLPNSTIESRYLTRILSGMNLTTERSKEQKAAVFTAAFANQMLS